MVMADTNLAHSSRKGDARAEMQRLRDHLDSKVIGQPVLTERLLLSLLADGHLLVEGAPGLAKTTAIKALSDAVEGDGHRIQFTPDLLPSDLTGSEVFQPETSSFRFEPGPVFHDFVLADEINRAPAKVQSALLEAMAERQVTVGAHTHRLPDLFLVMATQNPIEQEGTYPLPEAQLDRLLMYVRIDSLEADAEREVLRLVRRQARGEDEAEMEKITQDTVFEARRQVMSLHLSDALEEYIVQLVIATRDPGRYEPRLSEAVEWGASSRGTIALERCARARAWLHDRDYVSPEDVQNVAKDVLRHRVLLSFDAEVEGLDPDAFLDALIQRVPLP